MKISRDKLNALCRTRGLCLKDLLREAGVSRTAYYALARKESVLPGSLRRMAEHLGVSPAQFLRDDTAGVLRLHRLRRKADAICAAHPECDGDVVLRTLMNRDLKPVERLRKALRRASTLNTIQ